MRRGSLAAVHSVIGQLFRRAKGLAPMRATTIAVPNNCPLPRVREPKEHIVPRMCALAPKLSVKVCRMFFYGVRRRSQDDSDFRIRFPFGYPVKDFGFARGQPQTHKCFRPAIDVRFRHGRLQLLMNASQARASHSDNSFRKSAIQNGIARFRRIFERFSGTIERRARRSSRFTKVPSHNIWGTASSPISDTRQRMRMMQDARSRRGLES
jgi:hypothetical protein